MKSIVVALCSQCVSNLSDVALAPGQALVLETPESAEPPTRVSSSCRRLEDLQKLRSLFPDIGTCLVMNDRVCARGLCMLSFGLFFSALYCGACSMAPLWGRAAEQRSEWPASAAIPPVVGPDQDINNSALIL